MTPERLAEIRQACDTMPWGALPMVRELLDHIDGLKFANGVLDSAAKDAQSWLYEAQTAKEAYCELLEANRVTKEAGGVIAQLNGMIDELRTQLEEQRGAPDRAAWLTIDEMEHVIERGYPVFTIDAPRIERIPHNVARALAEAIAAASVAKGKEQRGVAVVVPDDAMAWMYAHGNDGSVLVCGEKASGEEFKAKFRAIPADRVLADGMVGVGREEWDALNQIASSVTIPPNGRARILDVDWAEAANGRRNLDAIRSAKGEAA